MTGIALKEARTTYGITQQGLGEMFNISGSMVSEIENGRRKLPKDIKPKAARTLDDAQLYLTLAREATGGIGAPYLNRIDDHRVCCVMKLREEVIEALNMLEEVMPILLKASGREGLQVRELDRLKVTIIEIIESITAAQNTVARLAKAYGFSLADLWDEHEAKLIKSGYLEIEKDCPGR